VDDLVLPSVTVKTLGIRNKLVSKPYQHFRGRDSPYTLQIMACRKRYVKHLGSPIGSLKSRRKADHYRERERPPDACGVSYQT